MAESILNADQQIKNAAFEKHKKMLMTYSADDILECVCYKLDNNEYIIVDRYNNSRIKTIVLDLETIKFDTENINMSFCGKWNPFRASKCDWDYRKKLREELEKKGFCEVERVITLDGTLRLRLHLKSEGVCGWLYDHLFRSYVTEGDYDYAPKYLQQTYNAFGDIKYGIWLNYD